MRATLFALVLLAAAAGCSQYHYYDLDVSIDPAFVQTEFSEITLCQLHVSGADDWTGVVSNHTPKDGLCSFTSHHLGIVEYSSLADSGSLTFKFDVLDGQTANCVIGEGTKTLSVGPTTAMDTLTVTRITGCLCGQNCSGAAAP